MKKKWSDYFSYVLGRKLEDVRHYLSDGLCIVVGNGKSRSLGGLKDLYFSSI